MYWSPGWSCTDHVADHTLFTCLTMHWSRGASESFLMSQLLAWGGQSTGVSALASFLPKKSQGWSPLDIFPSIRIFSNESAVCIRWPKYWGFSFSISPSTKYSGFISFRIYWFDLLAVQGTLKSLLQHHSSKASVFRFSALLTVQLSHPYMTTGNHSLD